MICSHKKGRTVWLKERLLPSLLARKKGQKKHNIESANLIVDHGMEGDAHAGNWHRQISLLGIKSIEHMRNKGADVKPGDFAENITVEGIVLYELPVGTRLQLGSEVLLEVTQIGKECHHGCEIMKQVGSCIMPTQGIFGKVLKNGTINIGDEVSIIK